MAVDMEKNKLTELRNKYESLCNEYVSIFCDKQGMDFEGWVADEIGCVAMCSDFYFSLREIILDMNTEQPKGEIINWYYENSGKKIINYYSYTKGLRLKDIENAKCDNL